MIVETFITWTIILNFVTAPPPLRVELAAEKENLKELPNIPENLPDFVIGKDDKDSNINIFEDNDYVDDSEDSNDAEKVDGFEPIYLPKDFVNYDLNGDRSIDISELAAVTGAMENIELAFNASDTDGDGKISETEFYSGPLNFDFDIDMENDTDISESIEIDDNVDIDEDLVGTDNWENHADENKVGIGHLKIQDNILYTDDKKISTENLGNTDTVIFRKDYVDPVTSGLISNGDESNDDDSIRNDEEKDNDDKDEAEEGDEDEYDDYSYDDDDDDDDEDEDEEDVQKMETDEDKIDNNSYADEAENVDDNDEGDNDDDEIDDDDSNEEESVDNGDENDNDIDNSLEDKDYDDGLDEEDDLENNRDEDDLDEDVDLGDNVDNVSSTDNDKLDTTEDTGDGDVIKDTYKTDEVNVNDNKTQ